MKTVFSISTFIFLISYSYLSFASDNIETEKYLDDMLSYQLDFKNQKDQLLSVIADIEYQLSKESENPYLWYLKGRSSFAGIYTFDEKDKRYSKHQKLIPIEYNKALALNKINNMLTGQQLYNIFTLAYSTSVSVKAARQYISIKKQKSELNKKEHINILRERIIPLLIKQNKFDEALKELNYIDNEFPGNAEGDTGNISWRIHFEKEIKLQNSDLAEAPAQGKVTEPAKSIKSEPVITIVNQQPAVEVEDAHQKEEAKQESYNNKVLIIGVVLAVLLLFGFIVARKKLK